MTGNYDLASLILLIAIWVMLVAIWVVLIIMLNR
jgi:hypothetical protein